MSARKIIVALLVVGFVWFYYSRKGTPSQSEIQESETVMAAAICQSGMVEELRKPYAKLGDADFVAAGQASIQKFKAYLDIHGSLKRDKKVLSYFAQKPREPYASADYLIKKASAQCPELLTDQSRLKGTLAGYMIASE